MSTNWELCFICQEKKKDEIRSSNDGWKMLSCILPQFLKYNALCFDFSRLQCNPNPDDLRNLFISKEALYHHSCQIKYSNSKLNRVVDKWKKIVDDDGPSSRDALSSPPCKRRASTRSDNIEGNKILICCFVWKLIKGKIL